MSKNGFISGAMIYTNDALLWLWSQGRVVCYIMYNEYVDTLVYFSHRRISCFTLEGAGEPRLLSWGGFLKKKPAALMPDGFFVTFPLNLAGFAPFGRTWEISEELLCLAEEIRIRHLDFNHKVSLKKFNNRLTRNFWAYEKVNMVNRNYCNDGRNRTNGSTLRSNI